jgi:hypothetical protein
MEENVDARDGVDLDGDVDMEWDDEDEKDEEGEDEKEEEEVDEDEEEDEDEDEDEDNGKEPRTIGQGEMVNTSADYADTIVDDLPTMLPEHGQYIRELTPRPQPPAPAPRTQTAEPRPRQRTLKSHILSGLEILGLGTQQKLRPAAPTL